MYLEEMHKGTYYKIRDRSGKIQRQVLISKEVRQGSVEGPLDFCGMLRLGPQWSSRAQGRGRTEIRQCTSVRSRATRSGDEVGRYL